MLGVKEICSEADNHRHGNTHVTLVPYIILDKKMLESNKLNYHPLHNQATTTINSNDLIKFISHFGNTFKIMEIPQKYL